MWYDLKQEAARTKSTPEVVMALVVWSLCRPVGRSVVPHAQARTWCQVTVIPRCSGKVMTQLLHVQQYLSSAQNVQACCHQFLDASPDPPTPTQVRGTHMLLM